MSTDSGIIISASGSKTLENDMKRLGKVLSDKFLPYSEKNLNAEFQCEFVEDVIKSTTKCEHEFGLIDADNGEEFIDLKSIPVNAQLKCSKCKELFFLFSAHELNGTPANQKNGSSHSDYPMVHTH